MFTGGVLNSVSSLWRRRLRRSGVPGADAPRRQPPGGGRLAAADAQGDKSYKSYNSYKSYKSYKEGAAPRGVIRFIRFIRFIRLIGIIRFMRLIRVIVGNASGSM